MTCRLALPIAMWAVLAATTVSPAAGVDAPSGERTVHTFGVSDWTDQALAVAAASVGPQKGASPLPPAFRDVRILSLPDGRIAILTLVSANGPRVLPLLSLCEPDVTADDYAVVGRVGYGGADEAADMEGSGYLELWSEFPGGGRYFSRTLADAGPMRKLTGHSAGRPFRLPFHTSPGQRPTRISLNLVLPGRASVTLGELKLVQDQPGTPPAAAAPPPWWARDRVTETATGLFGLVGCLGFAEPLMRRGRARGPVLTLVVAVGVLGEAYVGWAMARAGHGEPWRAWSPMLLCGLCGLCVPACIPVVNRRYREAELRRMRALDAVAA